MKVIRIEKPEKREVVIRVGEREEKERVIIVDGRGRGEYGIKVRVIHEGRGGKARVRVKGVVAQGGRLRGEGMIKILPEGQETESWLEMRGLMMDEESYIELDPQLEIEANEVKASHAASVGRVDERMMEFLEGMGINQKRGEEMIVEGFLEA